MAKQKFMPQTNSRFLSLNLNPEEPLAEEEQFWDGVYPCARAFSFMNL